MARYNTPPAHPDPTPEEIARECEEIRKTWSPRVEKKRRGIWEYQGLQVVQIRIHHRRKPSEQGGDGG